MTLSVVIVNYNVKYYLEQCLYALRKALEGVDAEVLVVDNHSKDGSVDYLSERFPEVNFISSNHNLGFARANNIAMQQSESDYVLLLNPDTVVGEHVIRESLDFMEKHSHVGSCGVRMLKETGENAMESRRGLPTPMTSFYKMSGLCARYPQNKRLGKYYMSYLPWDKPVRIDVVSGAFCLIRREALDKVGLLDEDFFMYGEDIDFSYRLMKGGYENWYLPLCILHYKGESTEKSSFRYVHVFYEAMFIFFRKHYGNMSILLSVPIKSAIYLKASWELIKMQTNRLRKSLGFFNRRKKDPDYIFLGKEGTLAECKRLALKKGLSSRFRVADERSLPNGHHDMIEEIGIRPTCVVYDVQAYRYEHILQIFSEQPRHNILIGMYDHHTKTIITGEEVLK